MPGFSPIQAIRSYILVLLALTFCLLCGMADAVSEDQSYSIHIVGTKEGLPANSISDIAQTPEGYLWLGTLFSGLLRYDGTRFVAFNLHNTPEFPYNAVYHLMTDTSGVLWISTYDGSLTIWDSTGFSLAGKQVGRVDAMLWSGSNHIIFLLHDGNLLNGVKVKEHWRWSCSEVAKEAGNQYCADGSGRILTLVGKTELGLWEHGRYQKLAPPNGLEKEPIRCLAADKRGTVWIGTDSSLLHLEEDRLVDRTPPEGVRAIRRIIASGESLWIESDNGMRRFANGKWMTKPILCSTETDAHLQFCQGDGKEGFWAANNQLGLIHLDPEGSLRIFSSADGLPGNSITSVFRDREGNIWLGYFRGALVQIRPRLIHSIVSEGNLGGAIVNSVCEDAEGAVWIGAAGTSVFRFKDGHCVNYSVPSPVKEPNTLVTVDSSNRIWAYGHCGALMRLENGVFIPIVKPTFLPRFVSLMLPTHDGHLWLGSPRSIGVVEGEKFTEVYTTDEYSRRPAALAETDDHTIWAGTYDGFLMRWNGRTFDTIEPPERSALGRLWAICPVSDGGMWIGTSEGGLLRWKNGKFSRLTMANGLRSNSVIQVQVDPAGNLWLVTGNGIERIDFSSLAKFEQGNTSILPVIQYGRGSGISESGGSIEFQPNCWRGQNGRLYFAMGSNVATVQPGEAGVNSVPPIPAIEELRVNQVRVWPASSACVSSQTDGSSTQIPHVTISPGHRDLEFQYTAPNFWAPSMVQFQYQLKGFESEWHSVNGERLARYYSVPPGNYVFRVRAASGDNVYNPKGTALALYLEPNFYQTAWFQWSTSLGVALTFAFIGWSTARRRMRYQLEILNSHHKLEEERARIAKDMHDELGSKLTRISYVSEMAKQNQILSGPSVSQIETIAQTSRELLRSMDEIVWAVNPRNDTLEHLAAYLGQYANEYLHNTSIKCSIDIPSLLPHLPVFSESRHHLFLSFKESLTNILKHSGASHVHIQMLITETEFQIHIADDGIGMDCAAGQFENFLPADADGLRNMRLRLEGIGGGCKIESTHGKGTTVVLSIPLKETK